jgi:hypothetical protein
MASQVFMIMSNGMKLQVRGGVSSGTVTASGLCKLAAYHQRV